MSTIIACIMVIIVLLTGIYFVVKDESKSMEIGAALFTLVLVGEVILTSYFSLI